MIVAVMACLNEADIVGDVLDHLAANGVDRVVVCDGGSTDGTRDILHRPHVDHYVDETVPFRQTAVMDDLIGRAGDLHADWVLPVDADEFWYSTDGRTIADALADVDDQKLYVPVFHHVDAERRYPTPKRPKVAFRWTPGLHIKMGNHDVDLPGHRADVLAAREIQFRSRDHFVRKVAERLYTLEPDLPEGEADHYRRLAGYDRAALDRVYDDICQAPTVHDPIGPYLRGVEW